MDFAMFYDYCSSKKAVEPTFPFDETTLVFKVGGKMFALADTEKFDSINLKCIPEKAIELRENFVAIEPGWHMNKTHWNTVRMNMDADDQLIRELIDLSYDLVFQSLTKKVKHEIEMG